MLGIGLGLVLFSGGAATLAGAACAIITLVTAIIGGKETYATSLRLWARQQLELARANVALMVVSLLAAPIFSVSVSSMLLSLWLRPQALTSRATPRQTVRCGHRRIAHIALTARVVPAPIARA